VQFANCASFDETGRLLEVQSVGRDITERNRLDAEAALLSHEWQDLYENSPAGHLSLDVAGKFIRVNETALGWLGCSREDLIGKKTLVNFLSSQGRHLFRNVFPKLKHLGYADDMQFDLCSLDGTVRRVTMASTTIRSADDNFLATRSVMNDVTEVERLKQHLAQTALEQSALLDNELIGMFKLRERCFVWLNRTGEQMLGYTQKELLGQSTRMLYVDQASFEEVGRLAAVALEAGNSCRTEVQLVRKDGSVFWADINGANMSSGHGDNMWLLVDATETRLANEQIARLAYHDALTGLPNRLMLADRLAQAKPLALRDGSQLAVCFLDLDGFKAVNDLHGHEAGDELLREVAARLLQAVRGNDTVSRLGGDEFVLLLNHLSQPEEHLEILKRATTALSQPVVLSSGAVVQVTTSVGVSFFPRHTVDTAELIRLADHAMYDAKKAGRNRIVTFQP
jgi:diguanylate cyclase (GGDEF)-like protein/PAS domain S-box-containing protein